MYRLLLLPLPRLLSFSRSHADLRSTTTTDSDELKTMIEDSATKGGELVWRMPLAPEYADSLISSARNLPPLLVLPSTHTLSLTSLQRPPHAPTHPLDLPSAHPPTPTARHDFQVR